MAFDLHFPESG